MKRLIVLTAVASLLLAACGEVPFYRSAAPMGSITWSTGGTAANRGPSARSVPVSRMSTDSSMDVYSDYYAGYGDLVGTYTPSALVIPIELGEILLADYAGAIGKEVFIQAPRGDELDDPEQFSADFVEPVDANGVAMPTGTYTLLELRFTDGHAVLYREDDGDVVYHHYVRNTVEVELPGYGGELSDVESTGLNFAASNWSPEDAGGQEAYDEKREQLTAIPPNTYYERHNTTGDTYEFTLNALMPRENPHPVEDWSKPGELPAEWYVFTSAVDAAQFGPSPNPTVSGGDMLLLPMDPIVADGLSQEARIVVSLDVEDIVEVYNNGTPVDPTDDIVVLADRYWERFTVSVVFE